MSVLCYHAVDPAWTAPMSMAPARFAEHARWLATHRDVLPLEVAVRHLDRTGRLPRGAVSLTFDDGFRTVWEHALPELTRHRLPATVFLVARTLAGEPDRVDWVDHPPDQPLRTLDLAQVREMQAAGITFASHSWTHADLTRLGEDECLRDLQESKDLLESVLRQRVDLLAYPRGRHDARVRRAVERAGYTRAFTLPETWEEVGPFTLPRVGIYHDNTTRHLRVKSSSSYLALRNGTAARLLHRARHGGGAA